MADYTDRNSTTDPAATPAGARFELAFRPAATKSTPAAVVEEAPAAAKKVSGADIPVYLYNGLRVMDIEDQEPLSAGEIESLDTLCEETEKEMKKEAALAILRGDRTSVARAPVPTSGALLQKRLEKRGNRAPTSDELASERTLVRIEEGKARSRAIRQRIEAAKRVKRGSGA